MQLQNASRKKAKIKMAFQGPSGSGKTKSSLLTAYGLCNDWSKIAVIDTENKSADLYADLGEYKVLTLEPPYSPERYIEAIQTCISSKMEVIIIDSVSHEWEGIGGILDIHANMVGNSFTNWAKVTPRHNAFVNTILQADAHIICTIRVKQDYVLSEKNGKHIPEKVGLKGIQRDGLDYEFTIVFDLDISLNASVSKDRSQLFKGKPSFIPHIKTGKQIWEWCNQGAITINEIKQKISICKSHMALVDLYHAYPQFQEQLVSEFTKRRQELSTSNKNFTTNGTT